MSYSSNYTITTLSGNVEQYNTPFLAAQAPFIPTGRIRQGTTGAPYTLVNGESKKYPFGAAPSYYIPFVYYDMETSSSTTVSAKGTNNFTGTLWDRGAAGENYKPHYTTENPFRGTYSVAFGSTSDHPGYNTTKAMIDFGTPAERQEWGTLFSSSWSISMWFRPAVPVGSWPNYSGLFHLKSLSSGYSFMTNYSDNSGSEGSMQWYVSNTTPGWNSWTKDQTSGALQPQQWNHIVYAISGSVTDPTARKVKCYVNNVLLDGDYHSDPFSSVINENDNVMFGHWYNAGAGWTTSGSVDEMSIWDFTLTDGQVDSLYNNGTGIDALQALPK